MILLSRPKPFLCGGFSSCRFFLTLPARLKGYPGRTVGQHFTVFRDGDEEGRGASFLAR